MSSIDRKIADRIAKLLAMTEDEATTENEKEVARRKAENLMDEHGLSEGDVHEDEYEIQTWDHPRYKNAPGWVKTLAVAASNFLGTYVIYSPSSESARFYVGGRPYDIEVWTYLMDSLQTQVWRLSDEYRDRHDAGRKSTNAYRLGVAAGLVERMGELVNSVSERQEQREGLVLRDEIQKKKRKAESVVRSEHRVGSGGSHTHRDAKAFRAGKKDSSNVRVHKGTTSGTRPKRLGS